MLLTGADTNCISEQQQQQQPQQQQQHEEISTSSSTNELSPNDEMTVPQLSMATVDSPPATSVESDDERLAAANEPIDDTSRSSRFSTANADAAATAAQLTQLSVPADENSAFKQYINAQMEDDHQPSFNQNTAATTTTTTTISGQSEEAKKESTCQHLDDQSSSSSSRSTLEVRLLVRRREAGALIGKKGTNIKRLRETFRASIFSIPDTGNGPERVVCIASDQKSIDPILADISQLLVEKSPENDEQVELKLLIHSSHAGSIIGIGGQSIKKLRNDSKAAIKIYEMCCPLSSERVCAIKARPPVVVSTIKLIQAILQENPIKGTIKPYDALHFDLSLVDKYGGYLPEEPIDLFANNYACHTQKYFKSPSQWPVEYCDPCEVVVHSRDNFHRVNQGAAGSKRDQQQAAAERGQNESGRTSKFNNHGPYNQINRSATSRFHPYAPAPAGCHQSQGYPSHRSSGSNSRHPASASALNHPSSGFPSAALIAAAAAAAAQGGHPPPRAPYSQLVGHHFNGTRTAACQPVNNQFTYPDGGTECSRHMRPCLCMFFPMIHEGNQHSHQHHHHHPSAAMLAAYAAQVAPLDPAEESYNSFQQAANELHQQQLSRQRETGSPNSSTGSGSGGCGGGGGGGSNGTGKINK